jgi:hypothetical protein
MNPIPIIQSAYMAQWAIERIHDTTSMETAADALKHYGRVLLEQPPAMHELLRSVQDDLDKPVPTLRQLYTRFFEEWERLYARVHGPLAA